MQTNPATDALVERVARAVAEAWRNDALPSERYSPEEVNWQDWLPEARAALDATPLAAMQERIERLESALEPFVRSLEWVDEDEMPVRISNDHSASAWDLTWAEVQEARTALGEE